MRDFLGSERNSQPELGACNDPARGVALATPLKTRFSKDCFQRPSSRTLLQEQAHRLAQSGTGLGDGIAATRHVEFRSVAHEGRPLFPNVGGKVDLWEPRLVLGQYLHHTNSIIVWSTCYTKV